MKKIYTIGIVAITVTILLVYLVSLMPGCTMSEGYFYRSWDGTRNYLGNDYEMALKMANGKPIFIGNYCN